MVRWFTSRVKRFWHWLGRLPKKVTIPIAVILVISISVGGFYFARFYNYMQDDPDFCMSCHLMEESWDRWATSEHKDVGCHDCHEQSIFASAMLLFDFVFGDYQDVESHALIPDDVCERCHESDDPNWRQVAATAGHQQHAEVEGIACTKCHSLTVHRFAAPGPICNVCHEDKHTEVSGMAQMHCTACHHYLAEEEVLSPVRRDCLDCHQALVPDGVTWPADAPMQYPCGDCHKPHQQANPLVDCLACHTVELMHLEGAHSATPCLTCHQAHEWQVTQREACLTCHPGQAEHYVDDFCGGCHRFN